MDGRKTDSYDLKPGQEVTVKADSKYNILVGNAGGVKLSLNDEPVHVPGKSGQIVNVDLP